MNELGLTLKNLFGSGKTKKNETDKPDPIPYEELNQFYKKDGIQFDEYGNPIYLEEIEQNITQP